jgi:ATP-dependent helicase HrpB
LLNRMGALAGVKLTDVGRQMIRLPLSSRLARVAVASKGDLDILRAVALLAERQSTAVQPAATSSDLLPPLDRWDEVPEPVKHLAEQLARILGAQRRTAAATPDRERSLGRALLSGYPDRVAQRREPTSSRFLLSTGTGAIAGDQTGVRNAEYVVALDIQGPTRAGETDSRIRMASAIDREWLIPTSTAVEYRVDDRGVVRARESDRYDALALKERPVAPDPERAADLLANEWLARPLSDADLRTMRRIRFAGFEVDLPALIRDAANGAGRLADISLAAALPRDLAIVLERHAPDTLLVPSGRRVPLHYADDGTVSASVKLQELFGLADTPRVGSRGEPLLLQLLAPNGRPVQLTRDLKSFWNRTYAEVRKELRGRYPKHPWPDDPWKAQPTHRTTRQRR